MNQIPTLEEIEIAKQLYKNRRYSTGYSKDIHAVGNFWEDGVMWCLGKIGTILTDQDAEIKKLKHIITESRIYSNITTHPKCSICEKNSCIGCEVYNQIQKSIQ
jgi:hypothetical protein